MNKRKPLGILTLLAVMLLSMAVFLSTSLADGKTSDDDPTPLPFATPTAAPFIATKTLTPEGNLTLVDDIASASSSDKQFITVVTKSGNYFFIIIDRAAETENVYFLNKVDEADLLSILEESGYEIATTPTSTPTTRPTAEMESTDDTDDEKSGGASLILVCVLAAAAVGVFVFLKKRKSTQKPAPRMEDFEYDYDDEDEEEPKEPKPPVCNEAVQKTGNWDGVL
ncbi:MAG TPA: DUF4366 domain-containing protein [Clostridia bacterium]|nr:DUF4366 domain-containing protein [Clostridia bacterium]